MQQGQFITVFPHPRRSDTAIREVKPGRSWGDACSPANREMRWLGAALWAFLLGTALVSLEKTRLQIGTAYPLGVAFSFGGLCLLYLTRSWYATAGRVYSAHVRLVFTILVLWCAVTICRADWFHAASVKQLLGGRHFVWAWVIPLTMVLGNHLYAWRAVLVFMSTVGVVGCLFVAVAWPLSWHTDHGLLMCCPTALVFWHYLPTRRRPIIAVGATVSLLLSTLSATRNEVLATGLLILFAAAIQFNRDQALRLRAQMLLILAGAAAIGIVFYVASAERVPLVGDHVNAGIAKFKAKFSVNTRAEEGGAFFPGYMNDMELNDFIVGRGCMGYYLSGSGVLRHHIECGYLQVVLQGGLVGLVPMLLLAWPALLLGLFRSRNWFVRGCALIILVWLIEMVPFGLPSTNVRYVVFWMAIGACLTPPLRMASDAEIVCWLRLTPTQGAVRRSVRLGW